MNRSLLIYLAEKFDRMHLTVKRVNLKRISTFFRAITEIFNSVQVKPCGKKYLFCDDFTHISCVQNLSG